MKVLGIIPARGNSKGIPRKNLAPCNGKPLIWWTIKEAQKSSLDALFVSTDCDDIAHYSSGLGCEVLWRPTDLATDTAKTVDVLRWHLEHNKACWGFDAVFTLQPTNPLRTWRTIDAGCALLFDGDGFARASSVVSFTDVGERHPARMYQTGFNNTMVPIQPMEWARRQDLPPRFVRTGEVYVTRTETIMGGSMSGRHCIPMLLAKEECWNVDDEVDLAIVETLMRRRA